MALYFLLMVNFARMKFQKILLFAVATFFISINLIGQENNQTNAKGQKIGKWNGFHENGKLRYEGNFENGLPVDTFYHYFYTGNLQSKLFHKSKTTVYATIFYDTGEIMAIGKYTNREKDSIWTSYGAKNIMVEKGNYIQGKKDGIWETYYASGAVSGNITYVNDVKHGDYILFFENGEVKEKSTFINGKLEGTSVIYDSKGNKILEGVYKTGKRDLNWIYYNEEEEVVKTLIYKNGALTNPEDLNNILDNIEEYEDNRKDVLEFEDLRGTIKYEKR